MIIGAKIDESEKMRALRARAVLAEQIVRVLWPYALSGSINTRTRRNKVVMEELIDRCLASDVQRIVNRNQWMAFEEWPSAPLPDMYASQYVMLGGRED